MFDRETQDPGRALSVLARMAPERICPEAEALLPQLGAVEVLQSRTGLVMLPMRDTVQGTDFHLGEVLVAEAHIRLTELGGEGYGMAVGRDLERAMAMAVLDAALGAGIEAGRLQALLAEEAARQEAEDRETLRAIAATRVEMETF